MLGNIDFTKILFLDIECVSEFAHFHELNERMQLLWYKKAKSIGALPKDVDEESDEYKQAIATSYTERAAIFAEFGKVICISVGFLAKNPDGTLQMRLKSFANDDEKVVLADFSNLISNSFNNPNVHFFCGHNIKEFDIPYICRRLIKHQMPLPAMLNVQNKKPWEVNYFIDTLLLWKFGDFKSFTSLSLMCAVFDIPTPKDDIDGSQVGSVYWNDNDLMRIAVYCQKDVAAVAQVLLYMDGVPRDEVLNIADNAIIVG